MNTENNYTRRQIATEDDFTRDQDRRFKTANPTIFVDPYSPPAPEMESQYYIPRADLNSSQHQNTIYDPIIKSGGLLGIIRTFFASLNEFLITIGLPTQFLVGVFVGIFLSWVTLILVWSVVLDA